MEHGGSEQARTAAWWDGALCISDVQVTPDEMRTLTPAGLVRLKEEMGFNLEHLAFAELSGGEGAFLRGPWRPEEYRTYLSECHLRGVRIVPYVNVHWVVEPFSSQHPDWLQVDGRGEAVVLAYGKGNAPCLNSGWRDWAIEQMLGMLTAYDVDGFFLDGPTYFPRACYCSACRRLFAESYQSAPPAWADRDAATWPAFVAFRAESLARFLRDLRAAVKGRKPDAVLYMNNASLGPTWHGSRDTRVLAPALDMLGNERANFQGPPESNPVWMPGAATRILETQVLTLDGPLPPPREPVRRRPTILYCCFRQLPWDYYELPPTEMRLLVGGALAGGASPQIMGGLRYMSPELRSAVAELLHLYSRHADVFVGTRSLARVAVVWPQRTIDYGGASRPDPATDWEQLVLAEFFGCYDALVRDQVPLDVLDEPALVGLTPAHYSALVLPNAECLGDRVAEALRSYVRQGGHLILTGFSARADADGRPRPDFALADVMGLTSKGVLSPRPYDYLELTNTDPAAAGHHRLVPAPEEAPHAQLAGAQPLARFYDKLPSRYFPLSIAADAPTALARQRYGAGVCTSFIGTFGAAYWRRRFPDYQQLLSQAVHLGTRPLIDVVNVPATVEVGHRYQPATGQHVVHLLNHTGEMEQPRRRAVPCRDVSITLIGTDVAEAAVLRSGSALPVETLGTDAHVTLPRLDDYEVVVFS